MADPSSRARLRTAHVIVVAHDLALRRLLVEELERDGWRVSTIDASEALDSASARDLIVAEANASGAEGLAELRDLRRQDQTTPIVLLTDLGDDEVLASALGLGATAVLEKPVEMTVLRDVVQREITRLH